MKLSLATAVLAASVSAQREPNPYLPEDCADKTLFSCAKNHTWYTSELPTEAGQEVVAEYETDGIKMMEEQMKIFARYNKERNIVQDGKVHRTVHVKYHACLPGTFQVEEGIEERFKHGVFAADPSKVFPILVRWSNAQHTFLYEDTEPDLRGIAIKIGNVLEEDNDPSHWVNSSGGVQTQDFLAVNFDTFFNLYSFGDLIRTTQAGDFSFPNFRTFLGRLWGQEEGEPKRSKADAFAAAFADLDGLDELKDYLLDPESGEVGVRDLLWTLAERWFSPFGTRARHSRTIRDIKPWGQTMKNGEGNPFLRFFFEPCEETEDNLPSTRRFDSGAPESIREDLSRHLKSKGLCWRFMAQEQDPNNVAEENAEDLTKTWKGQPIHLATWRVPKTDIHPSLRSDTEEECNKLLFTPGNTHVDNMVVGGVQRGRPDSYKASGEQREHIPNYDFRAEL